MKRLGSKEIPAFTHTARQLAQLSKNSDSCAADLAKVILSDPAMTAKLLRLVNSPAVNHSGRTIETVSYAIVVLGYDKVRNLAVTASVLETSIPSDAIGHVKKEMACAYHAALQAEKIAHLAGQRDTEDIYIAALLHRLGQIMFLCFPSGHQPAFSGDGPEDYQYVKQNELGFNLGELTKGLIQRWQLSPLLQHALHNKTNLDAKSACIIHGLKIAECAKYSWDTPDAVRQTVAISAFIGKTPDATRNWLIDNARQAEKQLQEMGLDHGTQFIAQPKSNNQLAKNQTTPVKNVVGLFSKTSVNTDPEQQKHRRLLEQLTELLTQDLDLRYFLLSMLEGIHSATGCDQSFVLLFKGKDKTLVVKQHLGRKSAALADQFIALAHDNNGNFTKFFDPDNACQWQRSTKVLAIAKDDITRQTFMTSPVKAFAQHLGYVVAVNSEHGKFTPDDFALFQRFTELGNAAFRLFIEKNT